MGEVDLDHDMAALAAGRDLEQLLVKTDAASDHIGLKRHNSFVFRLVFTVLDLLYLSIFPVNLKVRGLSVVVRELNKGQPGL